MECHEVAERLTDLMEGELAEEEETAALEHLASCSACETVLSETRDVVEVARQHGREPLSDDDRARMLGSLLGAIGDSESD